jgi:hypothetical protein
MAKKRKGKKRSIVLASIVRLDPRRWRERTVCPEKGKGRKDRPRKNDWMDLKDERYDCVA